MVLFEASLLGLVLVGAVDVYAYKKYRDSNAVAHSSQQSNKVKRVADAVNATSSTGMPRAGFSDDARKQVELLAAHNQPSEASLIVQDSARVGEVPLLGEELELETQPEFTAEEAVVEVTQGEETEGVLPAEDDDSPQEDEDAPGEEDDFDAEKASVDLSNEIGELRKELSSVKKELLLLKKKKR